MDNWKWYKVKLRHAKGMVTIRTYTTSLDKAIMLVCNAEYAPRSAVVAAWESR
jgi:hypothetical protein